MVRLFLRTFGLMKILIVNTSERTGGAAVAAKRLLEALNNNGIKAKMLVRDKETDDVRVVALHAAKRQQWRFLWERWVIFWHLHFQRKRLFEIDIANTGADITSLPEFKEADVIHLHWINQGMLSLSSVRKILQSGKPVVWTMHDLWPATAICHYARGCERFHEHCGRCPLLPGRGSAKDLSAKVWNRKYNLLQYQHVMFVACSRWLATQARQSGLLTHHTVTNIPNTIDTRVFRHTDKVEAREALQLPQDKHIVLFVSQRVTDERKGMDYLVAAVDKLTTDHPELREQAVVAVLGGHAEEVAGQLSLPVKALGYVSDPKKIVQVYNAADVFVLPSLEDNLPNTIMEAMACGVPCVGFKVGGIPEMIDHLLNGYVARYKQSDDLAHGLHWVLCEADREALCHEALKKVGKRYSQQSVALAYEEIYDQAMALKNYKL